MSGFNDRIIDEFRANEGRVGHGFENSTMVLLHSIGAKSGVERITPLVCFPETDAWVIVASAAGSPRHPAWFHNLVAHPETDIEVGAETVPVTATEVTGDDHARLYAAIAATNPAFSGYQEKATQRTIPLVRLSRR